MSSRLLLLMFAVMSGGCIPTSVCPLSDPAKAEIDENLIGTWKSQGNPSGEAIVIRRSTRKAQPAGVLEIVNENAPHDAQPGLFTTRLANTNCINVVVHDDSGQPMYLLAKYQVDGKLLKLWSLRSGECVKAIAQKQIKGKVEYGKGLVRITYVTFTDTQENLRRFVTEAAPRIWAKDPDSVYVRVE